MSSVSSSRENILILVICTILFFPNEHVITDSVIKTKEN